MWLATRRRFLFILAIACLAAVHDVSAQGSANNTGTGGIHTIKGRIYLPNGRTLDRQIKVELQSSTQPTLSVYTDNNGAFSFNGLNPGSYTVVVDAGDAFEIAKEYFLIDKEVQTSTMPVPPIPKIQTAPIYLQPKRSNNEPLKNGVVNAKAAGVPKNALQRFEQGVKLSQSGKNDEAIKELKESIAIYPSFALPHIELGKIYIRLGKLTDAVEAFRAALVIDPSDFEAHLNCGIALLNLRQLDSARDELNQAVARDQNAVTPHFYLGLVYIQKRDLDNAQKELESAKQLAVTNDFPPVHKYLGGIYWQRARDKANETERKDLYKMAIDELEKYIKLLPTATDAEKIRATIVQLRLNMG